MDKTTLNDTTLIRALAGDWDRTLVRLFYEYRKSDSAKRSRLGRVINSDLAQMRRDGYSPIVVEFYSLCSLVCFSGR